MSSRSVLCTRVAVWKPAQGAMCVSPNLGKPLNGSKLNSNTWSLKNFIQRPTLFGVLKSLYYKRCFWPFLDVFCHNKRFERWNYAKTLLSGLPASYPCEPVLQIHLHYNILFVFLNKTTKVVGVGRKLIHVRILILIIDDSASIHRLQFYFIFWTCEESLNGKLQLLFFFRTPELSSIMS